MRASKPTHSPQIAKVILEQREGDEASRVGGVGFVGARYKAGEGDGRKVYGNGATRLPHQAQLAVLLKDRRYLKESSLERSC